MLWKFQHASEHNYHVRLTKRDIALLTELVHHHRYVTLALRSPRQALETGEAAGMMDGPRRPSEAPP